MSDKLLPTLPLLKQIAYLFQALNGDMRCQRALLALVVQQEQRSLPQAVVLSGWTLLGMQAQLRCDEDVKTRNLYKCASLKFLQTCTTGLHSKKLS